MIWKSKKTVYCLTAVVMISALWGCGKKKQQDAESVSSGPAAVSAEMTAPEAFSEPETVSSADSLISGAKAEEPAGTDTETDSDPEVILLWSDSDEETLSDDSDVLILSDDPDEEIVLDDNDSDADVIILDDESDGDQEHEEEDDETDIILEDDSDEEERHDEDRERHERDDGDDGVVVIHDDGSDGHGSSGDSSSSGSDRDHREAGTYSDVDSETDEYVSIGGEIEVQTETDTYEGEEEPDIEPGNEATVTLLPDVVDEFGQLADTDDFSGGQEIGTAVSEETAPEFTGLLPETEVETGMEAGSDDSVSAEAREEEAEAQIRDTDSYVPVIKEESEAAAVESVPESVTESTAQEQEEPSDENPAEEAAESVIESVAEELTESVTESIEEAAESVTESVAEEAAESVIESIAEELPESAAESVAEEAVESVIESIAGEMTESVTESIAEEATESVAESVAEEPAESVSENAVEELLVGHVTGIRSFSIVEGMHPDVMAGVSWDETILKVEPDTNGVDWNSVGTQTLRYLITSVDGRQEIASIPVKINPDLDFHLYGMEGSVNIKVGESFNPMSGIKWDSEIASVEADVSGLDTGTPGTYLISYTLTAQDGRVQSTIRQITVTSASGDLYGDNASDSLGMFTTITDLGLWRLTAYMDTPADQGPYVGQTASGAPLIAGRTVAVSAATCARLGLQFGDRLMIDGHIYVLEDHGGYAMNDQNWVDIFVDNPADEYSDRFNRFAEVYLLR